MSLIPLGFWAASGGAAGAFDLLETVNITSNTDNVTFSAISQDYTHLQFRFVAQDYGGGIQSLITEFNNAAAAEYVDHRLVGDGTSVASASSSPSAFWIRPYRSVPTASTDGAGVFGVGVMDILDYSSATKNTTVKILHGSVGATYTTVALTSGAWLNTAPVTTIRLIRNFAVGTRLSLYGIKG